MIIKKFWTSIFPFIAAALAFVVIVSALVSEVTARSSREDAATAKLRERGHAEVLETFYGGNGRFIAICKFDDGGRAKVFKMDNAAFPLPGDRWSVKQMGECIYFSELISEGK